MAKKRVIRRSEKREGYHPQSVEKTLVENFVSLQRVMVNLSSKLDNLASQISKLLELFEISAKALAEKNFSVTGGDNEKVIQKIDTLLDQNKVIARGLTLMHEANSRQESYQKQDNYPQKENSAPVQPRVSEVNEYQKSIASGDVGNVESPLPAELKKFKKLP